ncbi:hypothetical protein CNR22_18315 [Sphingobacteriaceae bacterium]|nr:hypothetical protein CNR22_18315 [Sphingobacteriaceae bacterium]
MSDANHTFLPWARRGLASQISQTEIFDGTTQGTSNVTERPTIKAYVHVNVKNSSNAVVPASASPLDMDFQIIGPGDVIGIHPDAIVKTEPRDWITNFEPHSFPFIDFYEEDFPWRYSPAVAKFPSVPNATEGGKLRPWLTLIVLKEDEFTRATLKDAPLNAVVLDPLTTPLNRPLPFNEEVWAWAHVSVDDEVTPTNLDADLAALDQKIKDKPYIGISRLLCPRKLEENTSYYAFLIPTYETGRRAGLGLSTSGIMAQAPAWNHATPWPGTPDEQLGTFPIYHEWYFRTGATGDFEYLVRQVKPRLLDQRVGKRLMDIQDPGYGLQLASTAGPTAGTEMLEGALGIAGYNAPLFPTGTNETNYRNYLRDFINLGQDIQSATITNTIYTTLDPGNSSNSLGDDPIVTPPMYGRWHALQNKLNTSTGIPWLNELNLDPRYRVAASLGGDYVRKNQDLLMKEAWSQVGKVLDTNRKANIAQLTANTSAAMHAKHIASQPIEQILPMTTNVLGRIRSGTTTVKQAAVSSSMAVGATSSTFRRLSSPNGAIMRRVSFTVGQTNNPVARMIQGNAAPVAPKPALPLQYATFDISSLDYSVTAIKNAAIQPSIQFNISLPQGTMPSASYTVANNFKGSFSAYSGVYAAANWATPANAPNLTTSSATVADGINPSVTHTNSFYGSVNNPNQTTTPVVILPAMAAPSFKLPMYKSLLELGVDYLVPNLNLIPQNSITLLKSNQKFIEAFLAGANYEMGRELLWREYPTDQRGTYFKHFWSSVDATTPTTDITDMYSWGNTALGSHSTRPVTVGNTLVLAIRGDLLKKFPNIIIYAVPATYPPNQSGPGLDYSKKRIPDETAAVKMPIFRADIDPEITFLGFDLTDTAAKGDKTLNPPIPGWFFVLMERTGELRFGLDEPLPPPTLPLNNWAELTWDHVAKNYCKYLLLNQSPGFSSSAPSDAKVFKPESTDTLWAEDSAAMAQILYQQPVQVFIHANEMIP